MLDHAQYDPTIVDKSRAGKMAVWRLPSGRTVDVVIISEFPQVGWTLIDHEGETWTIDTTSLIEVH